MSESLDTRAARAMGWEWIEKLSGWNSKPGNSDATLNDLRTKRDWSPTTDANHFEEMLREIERRQLTYRLADSFGKDYRGSLVYWLKANLAQRTMVCCQILDAK